MKAIVNAPEDERRVTIADVDSPRPVSSEALVRVKAFSVNRGELALLRNRPAGWRPGQDIAGIVEEAASDGHGPQTGARVAALIEGGGWAELAAVPVDRLAVIPDSVSFEQAAALPMAGLTALGLVRRCGALLGKTLVVTGANGGVGSLAVQLGQTAGALVTAISRSDVSRFSAGPKSLRIVASIEALQGRHDFILESIGGATLEKAIGHLAPSGRLILFGNSSVDKSNLDIFSFFGAEDAVIETYFSYHAMSEAMIGPNLGDLLGRVARRDLVVELDRVLPWTEIESLLTRLGEQGKLGKLVATIP